MAHVYVRKSLTHENLWHMFVLEMLEMRIWLRHYKLLINPAIRIRAMSHTRMGFRATEPIRSEHRMHTAARKANYTEAGAVALKNSSGQT